MKVSLWFDYIYHAQNTNLSKINACYIHTFILRMVKRVFYSKPNFVLDQIDAD